MRVDYIPAAIEELQALPVNEQKATIKAFDKLAEFGDQLSYLTVARFRERDFENSVRGQGGLLGEHCINELVTRWPWRQSAPKLGRTRVGFAGEGTRRSIAWINTGRMRNAR